MPLFKKKNMYTHRWNRTRTENIICDIASALIYQFKTYTLRYIDFYDRNQLPKLCRVFCKIQFNGLSVPKKILSYLFEQNLSKHLRLFLGAGRS